MHDLCVRLQARRTVDVKPGDTNAARENLKNAQGHVIGYKEVARDDATGEELTQISLFVPRLGSRGQLIGYEERVRAARCCAISTGSVLAAASSTCAAAAATRATRSSPSRSRHARPIRRCRPPSCHP